MPSSKVFIFVYTYHHHHYHHHHNSKITKNNFNVTTNPNSIIMFGTHVSFWCFRYSNNYIFTWSSSFLLQLVKMSYCKESISNDGSRCSGRCITVINIIINIIAGVVNNSRSCTSSNCVTFKLFRWDTIFFNNNLLAFVPNYILLFDRMSIMQNNVVVNCHQCLVCLQLLSDFTEIKFHDRLPEVLKIWTFIVAHR